MRGPILYPRPYPPSRDPRPPRRELWLNMPVGWVIERLTAPFGRWDRATLTTPEIPVPISGLPAALVGYRIGLVTDLHHGPAVPGWWLERVAERCASLAPDLIVLGGDFVSHAPSDLHGLADVLSRFRAKDGVVGVLGNHDHWVGAEAVARALSEGGVDLLVNRHRIIRRGDGVFAIAGVDDFKHGAVRVEDAVAGVPAGAVTVLGSHNPDLIEYLPRGVRVDLMLSGHTHNGQFHWPWLGPLTAPTQFGGRYLHGLRRAGETWVYVSAGVGTGAIPWRRHNPPELPVLRLERAAD
jgi:uncharacterized protein